MIEVIVVLAIVAVAATLVGRSFYRTAAARAKGCSCVDECPLSDKCDPESGECVENIRRNEVTHTHS